MSSKSFSDNLKDKLSNVYKDYQDTVLVENIFQETSRDGKDFIRYVRLALTSTALVITFVQDQPFPLNTSNNILRNGSSQELLALYPWTTVKLFVFKRTSRQCIKAVFNDNRTRYFKLQEMPKMKIFWKIWCQYIEELHNSDKIWPFTVLSDNDVLYKQEVFKNYPVEIFILKSNPRGYAPKWTDKHLYLGTMREVEDTVRPRPVPGLGKTEDIRLLTLKPRYFGCWEQSEHWVQCGGSSDHFPGKITGKKTYDQL